jgi:hypothetical protein
VCVAAGELTVRPVVLRMRPFQAAFLLNMSTAFVVSGFPSAAQPLAVVARCKPKQSHNRSVLGARLDDNGM